jgi:hypothetical protein
VIAEVVASFLLSLIGVLLIAGEVQPIRSNAALHSRCA